MNSSTTSRQQILARISAATGRSLEAPPSESAIEELESAREYLRHGALKRDVVVQKMIERLRDYDAEVIETVPAQLLQAIASQLTASGGRVFIAPSGLPTEWRVAGFEWRVDHDLPIAAIETVNGVVTAATCGVADSGTIALHHAATEGRRAITLLPDWHLCILLASQIVETLPEYFDRCSQPPKLATYISGPSATADIEMTRIKGVHGPRFLCVILVRDEE